MPERSTDAEDTNSETEIETRPTKVNAIVATVQRVCDLCWFVEFIKTDLSIIRFRICIQDSGSMCQEYLLWTLFYK